MGLFRIYCDVSVSVTPELPCSHYLITRYFATVLSLVFMFMSVFRVRVRVVLVFVPVSVPLCIPSHDNSVLMSMSVCGYLRLRFCA